MTKDKTRFSILMTVYDQAPELEANLPAFLTQEYEPGYEVIVVDESSTDNSEDILKLHMNNFHHLYSTFLPKPNRRITRRKLAFNVGIKASKNETIIITKINNAPAAPDVLKAISEVIDERAMLTLGYFTRKGIRLQPFDDLEDAKNYIRRSERCIKKVREHKRGNYTWGRYNFIVIKREYAYDLLKLFEQTVHTTELFGIRLSILWKNLYRRPSTTLLVSE